MPLHFPQNRYPGVNAHLNSYLQQRNGSWTSFHADFVAALKRALNRILPENYYAITEQGLQISEIGLDEIRERGTRPDVSLFQQRPGASLPLPPAVHQPTLTMALPATFAVEEDEALLRVGLYHVQPADVRGTLVTALELLSPGNKPAGGNFRQYRKKRVDFLRGGVNLVEVDTLHEQPPVFEHVPSYAGGDAPSYPYLIAISRPYPSVEEGEFHLYGCAVDAPLPTIPVPLAGRDVVTLELQPAYNAAYADTPLYARIADYEALSVNIERYRDADQAAIRAILARIRQEGRG